MEPPRFDPPAPPPEPPPDEPGAGEQPPNSCPNCGEPFEPYQEYCLACGRRLVPLPGIYSRQDLWSRESPIWLWVALAVLFLVTAIAGAIVAVAAAGDDDGGAAIASTGPIPTTVPTNTLTGPTTITIGTTTFPTTTTLPTTTTFPTTTQPTTTTQGTIISWPAGTDGFSVFLKSTPTSEGRGPADTEAQRAINAGLPQVGVLNSSDYATLRPGYYVTFTGIYDTETEAESALPRARNSGFPLAYVREVSEN